MKGILKRLKHRGQVFFDKKPNVSPIDNMIRIGTKHGGWSIPNKLLTDKSICYLAGAGEDISFDIGIVDKYKCQVHIFDPTPRAKMHFDLLIESTRLNKRMPINNSPDNNYFLNKEDINSLHFNDVGLWDKDSEINFYAPKSPSDVSHSALNLQGTQEYFTARVNRLSTLMNSNGHHLIDLLKIDIEGAEYTVINSIIADNIAVKILCVEYDEMHNPLDNNFLRRIKGSMNKLVEYGFRLIDCDSHYNCTFVWGEVYDELMHYKSM